MPSEYKYDLFVSYSHEDAQWVSNLQHIIVQKIRHPVTRKKLTLYHDVVNMRAGFNWKNQLQQALADSACVLAVLSSAYAESDYCRMEWDFMDVEDPAALRGRILPIRLEVCDLPSNFTRLRQYRDFAYSQEFGSKEFEETFSELKEDIREVLKMPASERRFVEPHTHGHSITGVSPYYSLIEIAPNMQSRVVDAFVNDLRDTVLTEKCSAKVLTDETHNDVLRFGETLREADEICDALQRSFDVSSENPRRVFEWSKEFSKPQFKHSIVLTTFGGALFVYLTTSFPGVRVNDISSTPVGEAIMEMVKDKDFTAFPTVHNDIIANLNWHHGGDLLTPTYWYGYEEIDFPLRYLQTSRLLAMELDKMLGSAASHSSEIATESGRGLLAFSQQLQLVNQVHLFPYGKISETYGIFDAVSVFLYLYAQFDSFPSKLKPAVLDHLKLVPSRLLNSKVFSGSGALEHLVLEIEGRTTNKDSDEHDTTVVIDREGSVEKINIASLDEAAYAITRGFSYLTRADLEMGKVERIDKDEYTRILVAMPFPKGQNPKQGGMTDQLLEIIESVATWVAEERGLERDSVHSVTHSPYRLEDAIMFVLKINWKSYEGENETPLWDLGV